MHIGEQDAAAPEQEGIKQKLKDSSLKAAGYAYILGDGLLATSGMMAGRYKEASTGLFWGVGGVVCARYGNPDAEKQCERLSRRLGEYLRKQGVDIPKAPDTAALMREGGIIDRAEDFMYTYPSEILNTGYTVGAVQLLRSGLQHRKPWDTASGALVLAGALSGLLISEKKPDPEHPPQGAWEKVCQWAQAKPLRVSGAFYTLNNPTLAISAYKEMRDNPAQKSYLFKFLTVASYVFGNAMLMSSSKENVGADKQKALALEQLGERAAHVVAAQPAPLQEVLVQQIAGYLSAQAEVGRSADEIAGLLHTKLAQVQRPVVEGWQGRTQPTEIASPLAPL